MEMLKASASAWFYNDHTADLQRLFADLESHELYNAAVAGRVKLTRYALGFNPIPSLAMLQATYRWFQGRLRSCWATLPDVMSLVSGTRHAPSVTNSWLALLKVAMLAGQCRPSVAVIEAGMAALPAVDSKDAHHVYLVRRCAVLSLQVWRHTDVSPPASLVSPHLLPSTPPPYCDELLALIEQLIVDGAGLGFMFHYVHHVFSSVVDFRPDMPLAVHEAMLRMLTRYGAQFSFNARSIELARMEAALLIRQLQAGLRSEHTKEVEAAEAERLLTKAKGLVVYERTLALKVQMTWTELRVLQGRWEEAEVELQAALDDLPETEDTDCYWLVAARRMLDEVRERKQGHVTDNVHSSATVDGATIGS